MNFLYCWYLDLLTKHNFPEIIGIATFPLIPFIIIISVLVLTVLVLVLAERKLLGFFTQRKGPNRVGLWGSLQTIADAIKLLFKENINLDASDKFIFNLAPILAFTPVIIIWGLLPFSSEFDFLSFNFGTLLYIGLTFIPLLAVFLAGYTCNNKYSLIGAIRCIAQGLSYELPIMFVLLSIAVLSSSLNFTEITLAQSSKYGLFGWYIFPNILGFLILLITIPAELNRCPFDLSEAESELVAGYNTEYSGIKFALFFLAEYAMLFATSAFLVILFLGGFLSPFGTYFSTLLLGATKFSSICIYIEQVFWFFLKTFIVIYFYIWIRATLPRLPAYKLLEFSWKFLLPVSIINFFLVTIYKLTLGQ